MTETLTENAVDKAEAAFWSAIAEQFPECKTGDLSPLTTMRFRQVASEAVKEWVRGNSPLPQ